MLLALGLLCLCIGSTASAASFTDGTGHKVSHGLDAQRIVSLAPATTEMLFFLGLGERVVGRTSYCDFPLEATELPSVGGMVDTSLEKVVALKPDLVIAYQGNSLELIGQLRQLKLNVVAFPEAASLPEIGEQMSVLQRIVLPSSPDNEVGPQPPQPGDLALAAWQARLDELQVSAEANATTRPRFFYGLPAEVAYTAAPGSFIHDLIQRAGGSNIIPAGKQRWPQVNAEFILAAQPEWLLVGTPCTGHTELRQAGEDILNTLSADPVWRMLPAVRRGQVIIVDADILLRPGPRILDALAEVKSRLLGAVQ